MRWFSGLAILLYLSLLCTPQGFVVHDLRLAPLADQQLTAVTAKPHSLNERTLAADDNDDVVSGGENVAPAVTAPPVVTALPAFAAAGFYRYFSARAPPQP